MQTTPHNQSDETKTISPLQVFFDQLNDAVFLLDQKAKILHANQPAVALTGYSKEELTGKSVSFLFDCQSEEDSNHFYHFLYNRQISRYLACINQKSGGQTFFEITKLFLSWLSQEVICLILRNIPDQVPANTPQDSLFSPSASLDVNAIYDQILKEVKKLIPYDAGNILQVSKNSIHVSRAVGYEKFDEHLPDLIDQLHFEIESTPNIHSIVRQKKPLICSNIQTHPDWIDKETSSFFKSWIGVPILINDQVDSVMSLEKVEEAFFTPEHAAILSIFANQAAAAIKNARLFEAETNRTQQLESLQSTLTAINSNLELDKLLKEIVFRATRLLSVESGELAMYDQEKKSLEIIVSQKPHNNLTGNWVKLGNGIMGKAASSGKLVKIDKISKEVTEQSVNQSQGSHSEMAIPMFKGTQLLGVLAIADLKSRRIFSEEDVKLLTLFSQQAATAIINSQLFEEAKRRADEAETINQVGAVVAASLDQKEAIHLILEQLAHVIPFDVAAVLLHKNDHLAIVGGRGFENLEIMFDKKLMLADPLPSSEVFKRRESLRFGNIPKEFPEVNRETGAAEEIKSWLGAPLIIQDRVIGIILLNAYQYNAFTQDHIRLLTAFANQVAIAIENARLYTNLALSAEQLNTLYNLSQTISANLHSETIYPAIHQAVTELMAVDFFKICLFDQNKQTFHDVFFIDRGKSCALEERHLDEGLTSRVLRTGKTIFYSNFNAALAKEVGSVQLSNIKDEEVPHSIMIVPLTVEAKRIGTLTVGHFKSGMYENSHREILELLSANVAIAIENSRLFDEVQQLAITDPLTQIYNRRKFEELATQELDRASRYKHPLCLLMIDIDHFKSINDQYGHITGDQVLAEIAAICKNHIRSIDVLARYGGEEFVILLPETPSSEAMNIAERLRLACAETVFSTQSSTFHLTVSIGISEFNQKKTSLVELIDQADQALYISKNSNRNTCTLWLSQAKKSTKKKNMV